MEKVKKRVLKWLQSLNSLSWITFSRLILEAKFNHNNWFLLSLMLVLFMAGGSVLWPGCAELHGDPNLRMLLRLWESEVLLQRIPIEGRCPDSAPRGWSPSLADR